MNILYIDYTGGSLGNSKVKFHGGGDFSRFIIWKLQECNKISKKYEMVLLWPKTVDFKSLSTEEQLIRKTFKYIDIDTISEVAYCDNDILFFPLLDCISVKKIGFAKNKNQNMKIVGVLHGTRLLDVCKYDKYDKYYYKGVKSLDVVLWPRRKFAALMAKFYMKKNLPLADYIYTVSNCSMQKINEVAKTHHLKFFYRTITPVKKGNQTFYLKNNERYILFVNSNRYEKNFIRSLIAFCRYKEQEVDDDIKLYVIGATDLLKNNVRKIKDVNQNVVANSVNFLGYVDTISLNELYSKCEFLLYTSKSEGYGLPPMEAMEAGRPSVASSITSVPEVLGMAAYYVNPYDISDIQNGIAFMAKKENQMKYISIFDELKPVLYQRGELDINMLIRELLNS